MVSAPVVHGRLRSPRRSCSIAVAREQLGDQHVAEASRARARPRRPGGRPAAVHPRSRPAAAQRLRYAAPHIQRSGEPSSMCSPFRATAAAPDGNWKSSVEAELRVVRYLPTNLRAPEIAAELFVCDEHGQDAPASHLREARRPRSRRGGRPRPAARAAGTVTPTPLAAARSSET